MVELDLRDVLEPDQHVVAAVDNRFAQSLQVIVAADRSQQVAPLAAFDLAAGYVLVATSNRITHVADSKASVREPGCVDKNLHLPLGATPDVDLRDARHARQSGPDVVLDEVPHHVHVETARIAFFGKDRVVHE